APVVGLHATVLSGGDLVLPPRFDPRGFWRLAAASGATWANLAPQLVAALGDPPPAERPALRFVRTASAPIAPAVVDRFERVSGVAVVESYGISEAASQVTANDVPPGERRRGWVGRARGVEVKVALEDGSPVPAGATGEIMVRGRS